MKEKILCLVWIAIWPLVAVKIFRLVMLTYTEFFKSSVDGKEAMAWMTVLTMMAVWLVGPALLLFSDENDEKKAPIAVGREREASGIAS